VILQRVVYVASDHNKFLPVLSAAISKYRVIKWRTSPPRLRSHGTAPARKHIFHCPQERPIGCVEALVGENLTDTSNTSIDAEVSTNYKSQTRTGCHRRNCGTYRVSEPEAAFNMMSLQLVKRPINLEMFVVHTSLPKAHCCKSRPCPTITNALQNHSNNNNNTTPHVIN
jgi:hypothetical protein